MANPSHQTSRLRLSVVESNSKGASRIQAMRSIKYWMVKLPSFYLVVHLPWISLLRRLTVWQGHQLNLCEQATRGPLSQETLQSLWSNETSTSIQTLQMSCNQNVCCWTSLNISSIEPWAWTSACRPCAAPSHRKSIATSSAPDINGRTTKGSLWRKHTWTSKKCLLGLIPFFQLDPVNERLYRSGDCEFWWLFFQQIPEKSSLDCSSFPKAVSTRFYSTSALGMSCAPGGEGCAELLALGAGSGDDMPPQLSDRQISSHLTYVTMLLCKANQSARTQTQNECNNSNNKKTHSRSQCFI